MSDPFLGQIEVFGFNFPPKHWAQCNGQLLAINQNQALFALLGTTYGGNGTTTFALPDLRSRIPLGVGTDHGGTPWTWGEKAGTESITLGLSQIAAHTHAVMASSNTSVTSNTQLPNSTVGLGQTAGQEKGGGTLTVNAYVVDASPSAILGASAVTSATGGQPHDNRMPLLALNFCISLAGTFPSRN